MVEEKNVAATFVSARALLFKALVTMLLAGPAAAQTGVDANPPPASSGSSSPNERTAKELTARFVAGALPNANFIAAASRMATANSPNGKIRKFAETLAKDQAGVANSMAAFVNVNNAVVTLRNPYTGKIGPGAAKLSAPQMLPSQASNLRRLSAARGHGFDSIYVSAMMEALDQLRTLYHDFAQTGANPGLQAIAVRELPKVEQSISALNAL
jgi:predicted outer membrane protein